MDINNEWDLVAESYTEFVKKSLSANYRIQFITEHFTKIQNLKILDAGCGNGEYTHILTNNGAKVIGCDGSIEMLKIAKSKYPLYQFDHVNLLESIPYGDNEFDIVFCNMVLMDIDPIDNLISEFYRVVKNNGLFFISIVHPAFFLGNWEKDEKGTVISKKVTNYITPFVEKFNFWGITTHYHRPISFYFNKISEVGFSLNKMFEPIVDGDSRIPEIPIELCVEFIKIDRK